VELDGARVIAIEVSPSPAFVPGYDVRFGILGTKRCAAVPGRTAATATYAPLSLLLQGPYFHAALWYCRLLRNG